jgi:hypothetical protein
MWALTLTAAAVRLALPAAPERVAGALFIGLGCAGGLALPWARARAGTAPGVLLPTAPAGHRESATHGTERSL